MVKRLVNSKYKSKFIYPFTQYFVCTYGPGTVLGREETVNKFYPSFILLYYHSMPGIKQHLFKTFLRKKCDQELLCNAPKILLKVMHANTPHMAICAIHTNRTIVSIN